MAITLSKYFTLERLCHSDTAVRLGVSNMATNNTHIRNLTALAQNVLDSIVDFCGSIHINSGYRSPRLNVLVKGSSTSAHCHGSAADMVPTNGKMPLFQRKVLEWAKHNAFDQIIIEFPNQYGVASWIHIGYKGSSGGQRKIINYACKVNGETVYPRCTAADLKAFSFEGLSDEELNKKLTHKIMLGVSIIPLPEWVYKEERKNQHTTKIFKEMNNVITNLACLSLEELGIVTSNTKDTTNVLLIEDIIKSGEIKRVTPNKNYNDVSSVANKYCITDFRNNIEYKCPNTIEEIVCKQLKIKIENSSVNKPKKNVNVKAKATPKKKKQGKKTKKK